MPDGGRAHDRPARGLKFPHRGSIKRMDCRHCATVQRGIKLAPFAAGHHRSRSKAQRRQHLPDHHGIGGEHFAQKANRRAIGFAVLGHGNGACLNLAAGIVQHRAGQNIFGLSMGWNAKAWHVNAHDADAVDLIGQQAQRHA